MQNRIIEDIKAYIPVNEQEASDKKLILRLMDEYDDVFYRENDICHMTVSGWVTDRTHTKIVMAYHNIYDSWAWLGGHADGEEDLLKVAIKEVREECGIIDVKPLSESIISLEVLPVMPHIRKGKYVSGHLHLNVTYLLEANDSEPLKIREDENSAVAWIDPKEIDAYSKEVWFNDNIYSKLNRRLMEYRNSHD